MISAIYFFSHWRIGILAHAGTVDKIGVPGVCYNLCMSDQERRALERVFRATGAEEDAVRLAVYEERLDGQANLLHICFTRLLALFNQHEGQKNYHGHATIQDLANILATTLVHISEGDPLLQHPFLYRAPGGAPYEASGIVSAYYSKEYAQQRAYDLAAGWFLDFSYVLVQAYSNQAHSYQANWQYLIDHENYDGRRTPAVKPEVFYRETDGLEIRVSRAYETLDEDGRPRIEHFVSASLDGDIRKYVAYRNEGSSGIATVTRERPIRNENSILAFSLQSFPKLIDWNKLDLDYELKKHILFMVVPHRLELNVENVRRWLLLFRNHYFY
jgi:hypothetical protein